MNVGLVVTGFDKGGLEQVVYNLYDGYKKNGVNVYILCEKPELMGYFADQLYDVRDFCIFNGDKDLFFSFCYRKRITHLHYHYNTSYIEFARMCGIKTIYTIHNVYTWMSDNDINNYGNIVRKCDQIVAVSSYVKDYFCKRCKIHERSVSVIPNGINTKELLTNVELPDDLSRKGLGINSDEIVIGQIASFTPVKNQIGLIGVFEDVCLIKENVKLLLVGNILDQEYYNEFIDELSHSPIKEKVIIVPYLPHELMGSFLRKVVDISLLCSLQEGCSNTILESIVCKKPIVMTDVGNSKDINVNFVKIVPPAYQDLYKLNSDNISRLSREKKPANINEIKNALLDIIDNYSDYLDFIKESDDNKFEILDTSIMVEKYLDMYEHII